jgi:hypothetical protein
VIGRPLFKDPLDDGAPLTGAHVACQIVPNVEEVEFSSFMELELELVDVEL